MKRLYSTLLQLGHINASYIDAYLQGNPFAKCQNSVSQTCELLSPVGCLIHPDKSVLIPALKLQLLGFVLDSENTRVTLRPEKALKLKKILT